MTSESVLVNCHDVFAPSLEIFGMKKFFALACVSLFAVVAQAQSNPPGVAVPPNTPGVASDKAQRAGEMRKEMRPAGMAKPSAGDTPKVPEGGAIGTDKGAMAGERRAETRDDRKPNRAKPMPGGTPK